jgi:hypothetical protein
MRTGFLDSILHRWMKRSLGEAGTALGTCGRFEFVHIAASEISHWTDPYEIFLRLEV